MSQSDHDRAGPGLSDDARALIEGTLGADGPSQADRKRVHAALMAAIASGAGVAAGTAASTASAATGAASAGAGVAGLSTGFASLSLGAKLAVVALVVGAVGTTAAVVRPWEPPAETRAEAAPAQASETTPPIEALGVAGAGSLETGSLETGSLETGSLDTPLDEAPSDEDPSLEAASVAAIAAGPSPPDSRTAARQPSAARARRTAPTVEPAPSEPTPSVATPARSTLADEVQLLRRAQGAIHEQAPERALRLLAEHEARFPDGVLVAERDAARAMALCSTERTTEARAAVRRFLAQHPSSPLAPRVRAACE